MHNHTDLVIYMGWFFFFSSRTRLAAPFQSSAHGTSTTRPLPTVSRWSSAKPGMRRRAPSTWTPAPGQTLTWKTPITIRQQRRSTPTTAGQTPHQYIYTSFLPFPSLASHYWFQWKWKKKKRSSSDLWLVTCKLLLFIDLFLQKKWFCCVSPSPTQPWGSKGIPNITWCCYCRLVNAYSNDYTHPVENGPVLFCDGCSVVVRRLVLSSSSLSVSDNSAMYDLFSAGPTMYECMTVTWEIYGYMMIKNVMILCVLVDVWL